MNTLREKIAAELLIQGEAGDFDVWAKHWTVDRLQGMLATPHGGDCTKENFTCARCLAENHLALADRILALLQPEALRADFQSRVQPWMMECFGAEIAADKLERCDRFIEEALELVQAGDHPKERAHELVEYVYGRPQGDINQEVGGVMVTLAAHCLAHGVNMHEEAETELARVWTKVDQIRAKQAAKPKGSALPLPPAPHAEEDQ